MYQLCLDYIAKYWTDMDELTNFGTGELRRQLSEETISRIVGIMKKNSRKRPREDKSVQTETVQVAAEDVVDNEDDGDED